MAQAEGLKLAFDGEDQYILTETFQRFTRFSLCKNRIFPNRWKMCRIKIFKILFYQLPQCGYLPRGRYKTNLQ